MLRIRTVFTGVAGTPYYSNLYSQAGDDADSAAAACAAVGDFWSTFRPSWNAMLRYEVQADVAVINPATGGLTGAVVGQSATGIGTGVGEFLPLFTQLLIGWNTGVVSGGRFVRGKCFVPGFLEINNDGNGRPDSPLKNLALTAALKIVNSDSDFVVWSRKNGTTAPITSTQINGAWAVLRSRRD